MLKLLKLKKINLFLLINLLINQNILANNFSFEASKELPIEFSFLTECLWKNKRTLEEKALFIQRIMTLEKNINQMDHYNVTFFLKSELYKSILEIKVPNNMRLNTIKISDENFKKIFKRISIHHQSPCKLTSWLARAIQTDFNKYYTRKVLDAAFTYKNNYSPLEKKYIKTHRLLLPLTNLFYFYNKDQLHDFLLNSYSYIFQKITGLSSLYPKFSKTNLSSKKYFKYKYTELDNTNKNSDIFLKDAQQRKAHAKQVIKKTDKAKTDPSKIIDHILDSKIDNANKWVPEE
jgi:hypothetical protein